MATGPVQPPSAGGRRPLRGQRLRQPGGWWTGGTLPVPWAPAAAAGRQGRSSVQRGPRRQSRGGHGAGRERHGGHRIHE